MNKLVMLTLGLLLTATSCVSKKKFEALQADKDVLAASLEKTRTELNTCTTERSDLQNKVTGLEGNVSDLNNQLGQRDARITTLEGDVNKERGQRDAVYSSLSGSGIMTDAEAKKFQQAMESINELPESERSAALSRRLTTNLTNSLSDVSMQGMQVTTEGSAVYVTLTDQLMYKSGRSRLSDEAKSILNTVAAVINANPDVEVMVEGHTDSDPIRFTSNKSNLDLSLKRAMRVANFLEKDGEVNAARMIVAGRGEHVPKADNATDEGKAANRRVEIKLIPGLEQYFDLLTQK